MEEEAELLDKDLAPVDLFAGAKLLWDQKVQEPSNIENNSQVRKIFALNPSKKLVHSWIRGLLWSSKFFKNYVREFLG